MMFDIYKNKRVIIESIERDNNGKCWIAFKNKDKDDDFFIKMNISDSRYHTIYNLLESDMELDINCKIIIESKLL